MNTHIPFRVRARNVLRKFLPEQVFKYVQMVWILTGARFFDVQKIVDWHIRRFITDNPRVVQGGPFAGMEYVERSVGSNYLHKLIGSYEAVLHPHLDALKDFRFDTVIDIGAAEGYYLIGFGRWFPHARLVGFEIESIGQELIRELYVKNKLENFLVVEGEATAANLSSYLTPNTLLIVDCEGAEIDILDPSDAPLLRNVPVIIIELHEHIRPGSKEMIINRFSSTHAVTVVPFAMANPSQYPFLAAVTNPRDRFELLRERGCQEQEWLVMIKQDHRLKTTDE